MSKWINASLNERLVMLQSVADKKGIVDSAVEKDWWVSLTLKALFSLPYAPFLLFKGGTSLSKGWELISRFSEDIDITISRQYFIEVRKRKFAQCENNQQVKLLRKDSRDFISNELCYALADRIRQLGITDFTLEPLVYLTRENGTSQPIDHDSDPTTLILKYNSISQTKLPYVLPIVKIEISCLGMDEPFENRPIASLIYSAFPQEDDEIQMKIPTVLPSRTFLEKVFLLNEEFQRRVPRSMRMSRHLYDIEKLSHTHWKTDALEDTALYTKIVEHRKRFYHVGGVDYQKDLPQYVDFIPKSDLAKLYEADYADMLKTYIYDKSSALSYDDIISQLTILQNEFNKI